MATTIDATGLHRDRQDVILANLVARWQGIYGSGIDVSPASQDGQALGVISELVSDTLQILEAVYLARTPASALGADLSRLVQLIGITRNVATYSTAAVVLTGVAGTVIPSGSLIDTTAVPPAHFQTVGDVTIGSLGTSPGVVQATTTGPVLAAVGAISVIKTVISGWNAVTNAAVANLGSNQETDAALRVRRAASVAIDARSIADGLRAALANIQGVSQAVVFENRTGAPISRPGATDLPANSVQCVVQGGLDLDVATAIWTKASAGVTLVGATSVAVNDSQGIAQVIKFDRPIALDIRCAIFIKGPGLTASPAFNLAIRTAIANYGNATATIGQQIIRTRLFAPATDVVAGTGWWITDIQLVAPGAPFADDVDISTPFTQIPRWNASNVLLIAN